MEAGAANGVDEAGPENAPFIKNGRRREYKDWFKAQGVEECHKPGAPVSIIARHHDINANVVFRWRREYRLGILRPAPAPPRERGFVPLGFIGREGQAVSLPPKAKLPAAETSSCKNSFG